MNNTEIQSNIENAFRKQVKNDKRLRNAYLLVHSEKLNIDLNIAEGMTKDQPANPKQPNHLASVGKIFTATLIGILHEKGMLSFDDKIFKFLDDDLMHDLHIYKGKDYSKEITITHLLKQTSGLGDAFYRLYDRLVKEKIEITPKEAVIWVKNNLKPKFIPGKKNLYGDTNYYLLGLIIENVTKMPFHKAMHEFIFEPLKMNNSYMYGFSAPAEKSLYPQAELYIKDIELSTVNGIHQIDYAGGSVTAPLEEFLIFMRSLVGHKIIKAETLNQMLNDDVAMGFPIMGFDYGYSIWKLKSIPLILPAKYYCWGCVGVTGAFMFFHPQTESYVIGTFNDMSYVSKSIGFMIRKVIKQLL
jgi:D-alanyl-D-alanine carboxypeptidase